jgi:hypothetical protein
MPTVYTEVEVDVSLSDFTDDDLIEELENRGLGAETFDTTSSDLIHKIYHLRRLGRDYERELDQLIYQVTGKIV